MTHNLLKAMRMKLSLQTGNRESICGKQANILTVTTKNELERQEAEHDRLLTSLNANARKFDEMEHIFPRAVERFREMMDNLETVTIRDVTRARAQLRRLIGEGPLHPRNGYLEAELTGNYVGVLRLVDVDMTSRNNCGTEERT